MRIIKFQIEKISKADVSNHEKNLLNLIPVDFAMIPKDRHFEEAISAQMVKFSYD
jgi:hypothetical protein